MSEPAETKLMLDHDAFEIEIEGLAARIAERIVEDLQAAGLKGAALADLAGSIAFSVMSVIDGSDLGDDDGEGDPMVPILTFAKTADEPEALIWGGSTSWMHEMAFGLIEDISGGD